MLDIKFIEQNPQLVKDNSRMRGANVDIDKVIKLAGELKSLQQLLELDQKALNDTSASFSKTPLDQRDSLSKTATELKAKILAKKEIIRKLREDFHQELLKIPNLTSPEVPFGKTDEENVEVRSFGYPTSFDFKPEDHLAIGERLNLMDFEAGARVAGAKFFFLKNQAVLLELALIRYALDLAMKHGFSIVTTPELAKDDVIAASGFNPRGPESQIYSLREGNLSLIGTSEITIGGYMKDAVVDPKDLPVKISGLSRCFRTEAGSYGSESKGLYRVHQFTKVELYQFALPEESNDALEDILSIQEEYYQGLQLPYRVMLMCQGDLSAPAYKKYDIEAWMPFRNGFGEVTSVSNCTDFQSRRLNVRYKGTSGKPGGYVHTLNGTAVATTRTLLALLENNQQQDGTIKIPVVLQPYTGFSTIG